MAAEPEGRRARDVLIRYLEEMREAGEDEIYVSDEIARAVRESGAGAAGSGRPRADRTRVSARTKGDRQGRVRSGSGARAWRDSPLRSAGGGARPERRAGAAAQKTTAAEADRPEQADVPEPEIVEVELKIGPVSATRDMFAAGSPLDDCGSLEDVEKVALSCEECELARGRNNVVFGVGNPAASLMFVGEAPGRDEDLQGIPFVGRAGQLLDRILDAAGIERDDVYIGNIIKCRPPNNRTPLTSEIDACMPYLAKQIKYIEPRIICTLGLPATQTLLGVRGSMGSLRGKIYKHGDILIIPTYHPAAALRDPRYKKPIWEDFQVLKREYARR
jgi:uracil-DNA glycosylase family 4